MSESYELFNKIKEPIMVIDKDYNVIFMNETAEKEYSGRKGTKCYQISHNFEEPCWEHSEHPCPKKSMEDLNVDSFNVVHEHFTKNGKEYFEVRTYKDGENTIEFHLNITNLIKSLTKDLTNVENPVIKELKKQINTISKQFMNLLQQIHLGILVENENREVLIVNKTFQQLFNTDFLPEEINNKSDKIIFEKVKIKIGNNGFDFEEIINRKKPIYNKVINLTDGKIINLTFIPIQIDHQSKGYAWIFEDITEKYKLEQELIESEEKFRVLAETAPVGIFVQKIKFLYVNKAFSEILEYTVDELLNLESVLQVVHPDFREKVKKIVQERLKGIKKIHRYEIKILTKNGKEKWVEISSSATKYKGESVGIGFVIDITERKEWEEKLKTLATTDGLTGILNRYAFNKFLEEEIYRAERYSSKFSIILFDIDNFKKINDTYGHLTGDKVLKGIVKTVKKSIRKSDIFARWGGEEFIILLPDDSSVVKVAEKIRKSIENERFEGLPKITASFGTTTYKNGDSINSIIKRADKALYLAKEKGKNRVEYVE